MKTVEDLNWEIQQIAVAIDYFERAIENSYFVKQRDGHVKTVQKLEKQLKELERKRDLLPF